MKCVCGYKHIPKTELLINGSVVYENEPFQKYGGEFYIEEFRLPQRITFYACPKCGTLKVEV
jgi:hypothetical protein